MNKKKKKKREVSPFPRGKPFPPGKVHATKKDYDRRANRKIDIDNNSNGEG